MTKDIVGRRAKVASNLRNIADASRREDGTDIPLGQTCREAADLIESLSPPDGVGLTQGEDYDAANKDDWSPGISRNAWMADARGLRAALAAEKARGDGLAEALTDAASWVKELYGSHGPSWWCADKSPRFQKIESARAALSVQPEETNP